MLICCLAVFMVGCGDELLERVKYQKIIPDDKKSEVAEWITKTAEASNPLSDEEPEDMLLRINLMAIELYGKSTIGLFVGHAGTYWVFVPYEDLNPRQKKLCDDYLNGNQN